MSIIMEKKKVDPGWNDPPMLNYSVCNPPPKSRILNKRVAFPLDNTQTTRPNSTFHNEQASPLPPVLPQCSNLPVDNTYDTAEKIEDNVNCDVSDPSNYLLNFIKNEQDQKVFIESLKNNVFSDECKMNIKLLCEYLKKKDVNNVNDIKSKLLEDYKNMCDTWINSIEI